MGDLCKDSPPSSLSATSSPHSFTFFAISDFGNPTSELKEVAAAMDRYATRNQLPAMILGLGDNFYPYGVTSPNDSDFQEVWSDVFLKVNLIFQPLH